MKHFDYLSLPRQSDSAATCSGQLREKAVYFEVEEHLPFSPEGEGSHVWLYVQKTDTNTDWLAQEIARFAGVSPVAVGYAGLKDRHAVTSQWFSVNLQGLPEPDWLAFENEQIKIIKAVRHSKKLKRGALAGNRFRLRLTNITGDAAIWEKNLQTIAEQGVPNYFAEQRFGHFGNNLKKADQWFTEGTEPKKRNQRSIIISAARSWLFNLVMAERIRQNNWNQMLAGDVMLLAGTRASYFVAESKDDVLEQRIKEMDIHPTGPLWGKGEAISKGETLALEQSVLADWQDWQQQLEKLGLSQERRALRLFPQNFQWQFINESSLLLEFELGPGSYATAVLRELAEIQDMSQKISTASPGLNE
ncbi:tRNA pseudouridine(13) synthase TruD [Methylophaga sp. SB9B]|uniref:tRNA pseudouridine(13) synthase TruD n=1 Tax=Methylophaga sp. SB9B TaxID=2570356 RepID=UPI0010A8E711|nr:tRNA pseudouridine(13) synthase TruD [Methylophaga sp. SB9B]THK42005.1 tRNA pseudouridine(13) synthase TruD [Methylophaga sp. SB9B]